MKDIDAISLWEGDEPATRFDEVGRLLDPDSQRTRIVKLPLARVHDSPLPLDLVDYSLTVTAVDGEVLNSEVIESQVTNGHLRLTCPEAAPVMFP